MFQDSLAMSLPKPASNPLTQNRPPASASQETEIVVCATMSTWWIKFENKRIKIGASRTAQLGE